MDTNETTPETKIDLDQYRKDTTVACIKTIFKILGDNAEKLSHDQTTNVEVVNENIADVMTEIMFAMAEHKVPSKDFAYLGDYFKTIIYSLFTQVSTQKRNIEEEILARFIKAQNPVDGKFANEWTTFNDLLSRVKEMRQAQDVDGDSKYFYVKKEEDTEKTTDEAVEDTKEIE